MGTIKTETDALTAVVALEKRVAELEQKLARPLVINIDRLVGEIKCCPNDEEVKSEVTRALLDAVDGVNHLSSDNLIVDHNASCEEQKIDLALIRHFSAWARSRFSDSQRRAIERDLLNYVACKESIGDWSATREGELTWALLLEVSPEKSEGALRRFIDQHPMREELRRFFQG